MLCSRSRQHFQQDVQHQHRRFVGDLGIEAILGFFANELVQFVQVFFVKLDVGCAVQEDHLVGRVYKIDYAFEHRELMRLFRNHLDGFFEDDACDLGRGVQNRLVCYDRITTTIGTARKVFRRLGGRHHHSKEADGVKKMPACEAQLLVFIRQADGAHLVFWSCGSMLLLLLRIVPTCELFDTT